MQYFEIRTMLKQQTLDGKVQDSIIYHLYLQCIRSSSNLMEDEYTCLKFTVQFNNSEEVNIPSLANWKYYITNAESIQDSKKLVFGIDHKKFEQL